MTDTAYGDRLRRARIDHGASQTDLARAIDVSVTTISAVERGTRDLTAPKLFAWARECKVSLDWIAGEQPARPVTIDPTSVPLLELAAS